MMLRAITISQLGAVPGHPVLDIDAILNGFETTLTGSGSEAATKAHNWKKYPVAEIRELRKLKNCLQVLSVLADSEKVILSPDIQGWLALREQLP